jgi:hypothetical protein
MINYSRHKIKTQDLKNPEISARLDVYGPRHFDRDGSRMVTSASPFARSHSQHSPGLTATNQASRDTWGECVWVIFTAATAKKARLDQVTDNFVGQCPTNIKGRKEPRVIRFGVSS